MITERLKSSIIFITTLTGIWLLFYYSWLCCSCYSHNGFFVYKNNLIKEDTIGGNNVFIDEVVKNSRRVYRTHTTLKVLKRQEVTEINSQHDARAFKNLEVSYCLMRKDTRKTCPCFKWTLEHYILVFIKDFIQNGSGN